MFEDSNELLGAYLAESGEADLSGEEAVRRGVWEEGREVGEWTVTGFLGRGGSAEVYCAKHRRLGTRAALKVLCREEAGPRERFDRESRFLMGNPGPSFPAFYGAGVEEGRPWVAMELLEECPLPETDRAVARYLLDVGGGVAALHARGWLHRDIKQGNVLRRGDGHAVLADFGLLKAVGSGDAAADAAAERESPSVVDGRAAGVGTPGHSAPEQFAGGGATVAADVYALGMLAEECFGGKPPRVWERIIRRATAALPRQRYPGVEPLLRAIRRRHWARNAAWVALSCVLAAALGASLFRAGRAAVPERPEEAPQVAPAAETPPAPSSPELPEPDAPAGRREAAPPRPKSVREARAVALARFETDPERIMAVFSLLDDMQPNDPAWRRHSWIPTWSGRREVTQRQWTALMDENPSRFKGDDLPVDSLTPEACLEFLERLNATSLAREADRRYRLPAAEEWRRLAADQAPGTPAGRLEAGWFAENSGGRTHPGGEKGEDGQWADLFGNVRELTRSWGEADGREGFLCMGGSWASAAAEASEASVLEQPPSMLQFWEDSDPADPGDGTKPADRPQAVCPAPGEIGFRLWAEPRNPPPSPTSEALKAAVAHWESEAARQW